MIQRLPGWFIATILLLSLTLSASAQQTGGIRGMVYDKDFDAPLPAAQVSIAETGQIVTTSDEGNYVFGQVEPGAYTLVFSKEGYTRQVKADVVVSAGQMTESNAWLSGEFAEMEEFIVQDVQIGSGTEAALLELRLENPAMMDSISADLMSRAGASDAAGALNLVTGATVQEGKFAVIRGLPDRYVNSQMNAVRLPTADENKRAVELDQFPAAAIESVQVSKTFLPDQQGDASGGAVNVVLKGIPEAWSFKASAQTSYNTEVKNRDDFLTYDGGGVDFWGKDDGRRDIQPIPNPGTGANWDGPVGTSRGDAPQDYKWSISGGGKHEFEDGVKIGGFGSFFYERKSSFYDDGINDKYWVTIPGQPPTPVYSQGQPSEDKFFTSLFDVTQGREEVKWGALGMLGIETEKHSFTVTNLLTHTAEDTATLSEDTRGKHYFYDNFVDEDGNVYGPYDPADKDHYGNQDGLEGAPYLRFETLKYVERETSTLQFRGRHVLGDDEGDAEGWLSFGSPELDWGLAFSSASLNEPDKRQFGEKWWPTFTGSEANRGLHQPVQALETYKLGNLQRTWKSIDEDSTQYFLNLKFPFKQWTDTEGYFKFGYFNDKVKRDYDQESFSNFGESGPITRYRGPFENFWSTAFPDQVHLTKAAQIDVDYKGEQNIEAFYGMTDLPLNSNLDVIGGARFERTELSTIVIPESEATWMAPDSSVPVGFDLDPRAADVDFSQNVVLPAIALQYSPLEEVTLRGSYSETVARQTFKELTPVQQQEYLGADVFVGNPNLKMSSLENYDLRLDYTPQEGSLFSVSYFYKDITDPIEYFQRTTTFTFTTSTNYPKGTIEGWEFEARQDMGTLSKDLSGLTLGANATLIDSEVTLPKSEQAELKTLGQLTIHTRDMLNAPEHLYNAFVTYDIEHTGTELAVFYTVRGDTLVAGIGRNSSFIVPSVYETEYGTLNASLSQRLGEHWTLKLQAKNLLNPEIETVYRPEFGGSDVTKTSYRKGMEFSVSLSAAF